MNKLYIAMLLLFIDTQIHSWTGNKKPKKECANIVTTTKIPNLVSSHPIAMHVEAMQQRHTGMKQEMVGAIAMIRKCPDFGEQMLQDIMNLVDTELVIVNNLLCGKTGAIIEDAVLARNTLLSQSMPSVAFMYDKILDLATYDECSNTKLYDSGKCGCALASALNSYNKRDFLCSLMGKLTHYYEMLRAMQCDLSVACTQTAGGVPIDNAGGFISFCPVIK